MGQTLGIEEIDTAEVKLSINDDDFDALSAEDLIDLDEEKEKSDEVEGDEVVTEIKEFNLTDVSKILEKFTEACDLATETDPNLERAITLRNHIKQATRAYKELQIDLRNRSQKQTKMDDYLPKK